MKTTLFLLISLAGAAVARAQDAPPVAPAAPPSLPIAPPSPLTAPVVVAPVVVAPGANAGSWLASRGVLGVDDLGALMGTPFSPAQRARLQSAFATRNAILERANAGLAAQLDQILGQGDAQISARIETKTALDAEAERMERLKRLQPSRYRELMRRKAAENAPK